MPATGADFDIVETTISAIHAAYLSGRITCRQLIEMYLARIEAFDQRGPSLNSIIAVTPDVLAQADRADAQLAASGLSGPLHGIPIAVKDQVDVAGTATTLGSTLFQNYMPSHDATVVAKLRSAGAVIIAKTTLGEFGGGDTHGSLFGSTKNAYDMTRTAGGSSGGSAVSVAANLTTLAIGQEGLASIRRPAAWNSVVGMRPTIGLVSRAGVFGGWPSRAGSLGPMSRTVEDAARLLDVMIGYDPKDPSTAHGVSRTPQPCTAALGRVDLEGVRIGVLREPMGIGSDPASADFTAVTMVFDQAIADLQRARATVVDPIQIPELTALLAKRGAELPAEAFDAWMQEGNDPPFMSYADLVRSPEHERVRNRRAQNRAPFSATYPEFMVAREQLRTSLLKVMADNGLDVVVHKSVEHSPTTIKDALEPPFTGHKGATHLNTFVADVPAISVPAGFTPTGMPVGITFLSRPFMDALVIGVAHGYERVAPHRQPPASAPALTDSDQRLTPTK